MDKALHCLALSSPLVRLRQARPGGHLVCLILLCMFAHFAWSQAVASREELIHELPPCSRLQQMLGQGRNGTGVDQPYMAAMRAQGVRRAFTSVHLTRAGNEIKNFQIVERAYYDQYDAPDSQIVDEGKLNKIRESGLERMLDGLVRERVSKAPVFWGVERPLFFHTNAFYSHVEFFSTPWLQEQRSLIFPLKKTPTAFFVIAGSGDLIPVKNILSTTHFQQRELNQALFGAALSLYNNTAIINLLVDAGADVNAKTKDGDTPLMNAVSRPCNLIPLLARGARVDEHDRYGVTALKRAELQKVVEAERILRQAGAQE